MFNESESNNHCPAMLRIVNCFESETGNELGCFSISTNVLPLANLRLVSAPKSFHQTSFAGSLVSKL